MKNRVKMTHSLITPEYTAEEDSEAYSEPYQTSTMEYLAKIVNGQQPLLFLQHTPS